MKNGNQITKSYQDPGYDTYFDGFLNYYAERERIKLSERNEIKKRNEGDKNKYAEYKKKNIIF